MANSHILKALKTLHVGISKFYYYMCVTSYFVLHVQFSCHGKECKNKLTYTTPAWAVSVTESPVLRYCPFPAMFSPMPF